MRATFLTQYWPPEMGAPQVRLSELATRLMDRGFEIEVITALPNYPKGRVYDGYDARRVTIDDGPPRVVRVPFFIAQSGFAARLASYHSFAASAALFGARHGTRPDVLYVESPPLFIGWAALALSTYWRCPFVLNVSDLWPRSAIEMGYVKDGPWLEPARRLERALYARAAGVTGQTEEIIDEVRRTSPRARTLVVTNGVDPRRFGDVPVEARHRAVLGDAPGPVFLYAGLFGHAQGLDQILDVAKAMGASEPGRFVLVGDGPERARLIARVEREGLTRLRIVDAVPRDDVPGLLAGADVAIITLGARLKGAVPSKIYEAMGAARPILLVAEGEAVDRVRRAEAGLTVDIDDAAGLLAAVRTLARDDAKRRALGAAGRRAAETVYDRSVIVERLEAFLREAARR